MEAGDSLSGRSAGRKAPPYPFTDGRACRVLPAHVSLPAMIRSSLLLLCLALFLPASAQQIPDPATLVSLRVETAELPLATRRLDVGLRVEIAEGWHINAHEASLPYLIPTNLDVIPPEGFRVTGVSYPEPESFEFGFAGSERLEVYSGTVQLIVGLEGDSGFRAAGIEFLSKLRFQACNDEQCLPPATIERMFVVKSTGAEAGVSQPAETDLAGGAVLEGWIAEYGLLPALGLVMLMGLGLNLTPCVYPLVSVTLAYFGGQSGRSRPGTLILAGFYALGIAITFSMLGLMAALSGGFFGAALQQPATLIGIAAILIALAFSNFGLYTIQPPAALTQRLGASVVGVSGALFMGLTMGIVAAPCVGPIVVGLLLAVGAMADPALGFILFFALALGLSLPYVGLAAFAGSISELPRSGAWLLWIEHLFGAVLLGMALWFVSPLLPEDSLATVLPVLIAGSAIFLGFLDRSGDGMRAFSWIKRGGALAAVGIAAWMVFPGAVPKYELTWAPLSSQALAAARAAGRPAVVDFRADWCLPCIEMEKTTFADPVVREAAADFAMFEADVTAMSEENEDLLLSYVVRGVPTTIFYDANGEERRRVVGFVASEEFLELLAEVRAQFSTLGTRPAWSPDRGAERPAG